MSLPQNPFTSLSVPSMNPSSNKRGKQMLADQAKKFDRISTLPDHVLLLILTRMSTEKAVQTSVLSKVWEGVWKQMPYLSFDMMNTIEFNVEPLAVRSEFIAQLITKVINNHNGHLEGCRIRHFSYQSKDGTLETWIRSLIHVKQTKCLDLVNLRGHRKRAHVIHLPPNIFSHPSLTTLFMFRYDFESAHAFKNCNNLLILKLELVCAEVGVFNTVIASCPSLRVLVLDITSYSRMECLKIHNNKLKVLHLACTRIDSIEVFTALLDIFSIYCCFGTINNLVLVAPRILRFHKLVLDENRNRPPIFYNIACSDQELENIGHEFVVSRNPYSYSVARFTSLVVDVDLMNPREVNMLKKVLDSWPGEMRKLEIFFKHNNVPKEEDGSQEKGWMKEYLFLNADFRVNDVWMHNLDGLSENEFSLASRFVTQGTVRKKLMIKTSSIVLKKKLEIEAAVAKLMELPKGNKELSIECF